MSAPASDEIKLFDAPDLSALKRNWHRIALRVAAAIVIPILIVWLAKVLHFYGPVASLRLPLDSLDAGPFAYEAKVIWVVVLTLIVLAYLVPKRTPALVMAICSGAILWTGYLYTKLQWTRLFNNFNFLQQSAPPASAWIFAALILLAGVAFLLVENLLETRAQQEGRKLDADETRAVYDVAWRTLGTSFAAGVGAAVVLGSAYFGLRAMLDGARLPFRLNPVFVLFAMGLALAVLVAIAARKRNPVHAAFVPLPASAAAAPAVVRPASAQAADATAASEVAFTRLSSFTFWEKAHLAAAVLAGASVALPWQTIRPFDGGAAFNVWGAALGGVWVLTGGAAASAALLFLAPRRSARRFVLPGMWAVLVLVAFGSASGASIDVYGRGLATASLGPWVAVGGAILALLAALATIRAPRP